MDPGRLPTTRGLWDKSGSPKALVQNLHARRSKSYKQTPVTLVPPTVPWTRAAPVGLQQELLSDRNPRA